ncbi:MAG: FAD-dependent oxidoreductase [Pirellulaceae bacterium]|nr:FAD-dependent oxidoreductase [Pirellulaceae bacterium]
MNSRRIVVLGGGFAGLWSTVGAVRKLDELGLGPREVEVTLVNRDAYHGIRVRNYEADLSSVRVPLADVLEPIGARLVVGEIANLDPPKQTVEVTTATGPRVLPYDRLVFALGSQLLRPSIAGIETAFDVDTFAGATRLAEHLRSLPSRPATDGQFTVVVVGSGLTGIEVATEMISRLAALLSSRKDAPRGRVILADHQPRLGSDMGEFARPVIAKALAALGIETRLGVEIAAIRPTGVLLRDGETIATATVVWCAGMRASPLTALFPVECDRLGRLPVDAFLRLRGVPGVFAAGDSAWLTIDDSHVSVMSCQHGRPMGRFAGHNVVCDLLGLPLLPLSIPWYVTVLDLGTWGAVCTAGWDRQVIRQGAAAKETKRIINCERIYPPANRDRAAILAAAAPMVQPPPEVDSNDSGR